MDHISDPLVVWAQSEPSNLTYRLKKWKTKFSIFFIFGLFHLLGTPGGGDKICVDPPETTLGNLACIDLNLQYNFSKLLF